VLAKKINIEFFVEVNFFCYYKKGLGMKAISFIKNNAMAMVASAAIVGFSAFKIVDEPKQSTRILAFNATTNQYEEVANYDPNNCDPGTQICSYKTEAESGSAPGQVPTQIPLEQLDNYLHLMDENGLPNKQYNFSN